MPQQVTYYNQFSQQFQDSILQCPEPHLWTTDYKEKGRIYRLMKERVKQQQKMAAVNLNKETVVLDIGCGFGRQAFMLAKEGYKVHGVDTSDEFIWLAQKLFEQHQLEGVFDCADITKQKNGNKYDQALLFDVLEHIPPSARGRFVQSIAGYLEKNAVLIISLPKVKKRLSSWVNNNIVRGLLQHFPSYVSSREHPYPIPVERDVKKLFSMFQLAESSSTTDTNYYVFRKG